MNNYHTIQESYYEKYQACKQSWKMGAIFGTLTGILLSLLIAGFEFSNTFFILLPFQTIAGIWVVSTAFALKYTQGYGCSRIANGIFRFGMLGFDYFAGTYVLLWVAVTIIAIALLFWFIGFMLFVFIFPLQTLYYGLRCRSQKRDVSNSVAASSTAV